MDGSATGVPALWQRMPMHNVPVQPTPFIGREQEMLVVRQHLFDPHVHLLTLTGPAGTGKTRLAIQALADMLDEFPDGVWYVELGLVADAGLVASTLATTFGIQEGARLSLADSLKTYLRERRLLLVLDNFEQVLPAGTLISDLVQASAGLKVMVTSREALHLRGEREIRVPPLAVPDARALSDAGTLGRYEAVRLFIARARDVMAEFTPTVATTRTIAEICIRLDGLPLAIELAAARIRLLPPPALLARLEGRLKLLTGGARDLPSRQQTLRDAIDWSYNLLDPGEQRLFRRLAVFTGGWTIDAAEAVCSLDAAIATDVLDGLQSLLDKSLLLRVEGGDESRFRMLETIREYAAEHLAASGELDAMREQHAAYFLQFAETAEPWLTTREQTSWLDRLDADYANLRAALEWSAEQPQDDLGLRLAGALHRFWLDRGHLNEGRVQLIQALARTDDTPPGATTSGADNRRRVLARAKALAAAGELSGDRGEFVVARTYCEQSIALFRGLEDFPGARMGLADVLTGFAWIDDYEGDSERAASNMEEGVAIFRQLADRWMLNWGLQRMGLRYRMLGDHARAAAVFAEFLGLARKDDDHASVAVALLELGTVALHQGDHTRAAPLLAESVELFRSVQDKVVSGWAHISLAEAMRLVGDLRAVVPFDGGGMTVEGLLDEGLALIRAADVRIILSLALLEAAEIAFEIGNDAMATAYLAQGIRLAREIGMTYGIALLLDAYAGLAAACGSHSNGAGRAARLWGAAATMHSQMLARLSPIRRDRYERARAAARSELGETAWQAAWAEGQAMTVEQAIAYAREQETELAPPAKPLPAPVTLPLHSIPDYPAGLTEREVEILRLLSRGLTYVKIAEALIISPHTVNAHLRTIYSKLGVTSRSAATRFAVEQHLV